MVINEKIQNKLEIYNGLNAKGLKKITYVFSQFKKNFLDWKWYYYQFTNKLLWLFFLTEKNVGVYIVKKNWDQLIILDACRYDSFETSLKVLNTKGELSKVISRGSNTPQFLKENFSGSKYPDIIYITSNPFVEVLLKKKFFMVVNVWKKRWNETLGTVEPEYVISEALRIKRKYPDKKLIIHFMQPHSPYIGTFKNLVAFGKLHYQRGKK